ncbi:MAG TPA: efflux transporter outer membrane subunit, partial [Chthoniobacterales bacterium]
LPPTRALLRLTRAEKPTLRPSQPASRQLAKAIVPVLLGLCLGACSVGPIYRGAPAAEKSAPAHYKNADQRSNKFQRGGKESSDNWWTIFRDPALDRLEADALNANQDLRVAAARIAEGRAQSRAAAADFFPKIDLDAQAERMRNSNNLPYQKGKLIGSNPFGGGGGSPVITNQPLTTTQNDFRVPAELNWEVDLFGRVRHQYAAARAQAQALDDDYRAMQLSVTANVATAYFTLRALDSELGVLGRTVKTREGTFKIAQERLQAGLTSDLDVARAQTDLAATQAAGFSVQRARAEMENALGTLLGEAASDFRFPPRPLTGAVPRIPAGLPSDLLERRPDIAAAERQLAAENERVGVATADFFPRLPLTGAGGFESADFGLLFNPESRFWQIGPSLTIPIFEGGRNVANLEAAKARYEQALGRYRQQLLVGFQEVENALVDLRSISGEAEAQGRAVAAAQRTLDLSQQQYQKGATNFLDVLDAERTLLQGQRAQTELLGQQMQATVQLIKALGGDWHA